jgi:hypothetical protein
MGVSFTRKPMNTLFRILFTFSLVLPFNVSASWDGVASGIIDTIQVTSGQNYGFRVSLKGNAKLCGNDHSWAYLNESDSNYKSYISVLLAAKMADKTVSLYANQEKSSGKNYCHIGHLALK